MSFKVVLLVADDNSWLPPMMSFISPIRIEDTQPPPDWVTSHEYLFCTYTGTCENIVHLCTRHHTITPITTAASDLMHHFLARPRAPAEDGWP